MKETKVSKSRRSKSGGEKRSRVSSFARRLLAEWGRLELAREGRVVVAVSGGADSTALLAACAELARAELLKVELVAAHLEHGLRGAAGEADARWVEELARGLGVECVVGRARVGERAEKSKDNLEQAARRARYEFLGRTAREHAAQLVLTAHTQDDQAETVLMRLLRGSGTEGLAGIPPLRRMQEADGALVLARPLLCWARRAETEEFCREHGLAPRTDEMNLDERFARVRVRRKLLPLLESFNPRAVEALARTAALLREDAATLEVEAARLLGEAAEGATEKKRGDGRATGKRSVGAETSPELKIEPGKSSRAFDYVMLSKRGETASKSEDESALRSEVESGAPPLRVSVLAGAPLALRRRALRLWIGRGRGDLRRVEMVHVSALEKLLEGERGGRVAELPGGCQVERRRGWLLFRGRETSEELKKV